LQIGDRVYLMGGYTGQVVVEDGVTVSVALDGGGEIGVPLKDVRVVGEGFQTWHVGDWRVAADGEACAPGQWTRVWRGRVVEDLLDGLAAA